MLCPTVGIIAFPGINTFLFTQPHFIFGLHIPEKLFEVHIFTLDDESVDIDGFMRIEPTRKLAEIKGMDIIVTPGWDSFDHRPPESLLEAFKEAHAAGSQLVGLCYGAYALAYSGLLNGKKATTHWMAEGDFRRRFPAVKLNRNSLYVDDGGIITSAGVSAGIDCCIYIINKIHGYRIANALGRILVSSPYREGGQAQFIDLPAETPREPNINAITDFLGANIRGAHTLNEIAERFSLSRRTLIRRFELATGMSIKKWLVNLRLKRCCELLESTSWSIEKIADETGFGSAALLRHHFSRQFCVSPRKWRDNFFNIDRKN